MRAHLALLTSALIALAGSLAGGPITVGVRPAVMVAAAANLNADEIEHAVAPALAEVSVDLPAQHAVGSGTGIVLTSDGEVLTNNHVVAGGSTIRVTDIGNGESYPAYIVGTDRTHDLALLQLRGASGLTTARLGDSGSAQVGQPIAALGDAGGVRGRLQVALGRITGLNRSIEPRDNLTGSKERLTGLIQVAANIQQGDSGGPVVNAQGQVIAAPWRRRSVRTVARPAPASPYRSARRWPRSAGSGRTRGRPDHPVCCRSEPAGSHGLGGHGIAGLGSR
ncbi:MAG TPA: S1C family serine protease [Pseudonocardia sp.]